MIIRIISIPIIITILSFLFGTNYSIYNTIKVDSLITLRISFVGDIMCHSPQIDYARINSDSFDFRPSFSEVKKYFDEADLVFGNLETVTAGKKEFYTGYPLFNSPDEFIEALKYAGFDVLFTSNNHSLDRGIKGVERTIDIIKQNNLIPVGTLKRKVERDSSIILEKNGIRIGLLAYTYGLNGNFLPKSNYYSVSLIDTSLIKKDIENLKNKKPDLILVYFHFGEEYSRKPSKYQRDIVEKTILYGADFIIGSHPHVIQPIEYFHSNKNRIGKGVIAYSLGNFISNQRWRYSDAGVILNIQIIKNIFKDSLWIDDTSIIPTWVYKGNTKNGKNFIILPADTSLFEIIPEYLTENELFLMNQSFYDTKKMFLPGEHTKK